MLYYFGSRGFALLFTLGPAFRYIFFGDFDYAQPPKKDAAAIGAKNFG